MTLNFKNFKIGLDQKFILMAGPCVIESEDLCFEIAERLKNITQKLKINFIFKASFDKANRSSINSFRGLGVEQGLEILNKIKNSLNIPVMTDVHEDTDLNLVSNIVDVLQTPAFLCRQTNFMQKVAVQNKLINIKKGQFLSPSEMQNVVKKVKATGNHNILVCERGFTFGYHDLIVDMRSLMLLRNTGCPVIFDATHSVQRPGLAGDYSGGDRKFIPILARAAVAAGISGLFMETHPEPEKSLSDSATIFPLDQIENLLINLVNIDNIIKNNKNIFLEDVIL